MPENKLGTQEGTKGKNKYHLNVRSINIGVNI
jgi:hypothetical protein